MDLFLRSLWGSKRQSVSVIFICACIIFIFVRSAFTEELMSVEGALRKIFPKASHFDRRVVKLSAEQIRSTEQSARLTFLGKHSDQVIVHIAQEQGGAVGYAFEDTVIGKWGLIHYLAGLDTNGAVSQIIILDYQEIRGRPIAKPRFLRQPPRQPATSTVASCNRR